MITNLNIVPLGTSDISINHEDIYKDEYSDEEQEIELQRTEEWQEQRKGNWTGSQFKQLMTSTPKGGKLDWFALEKIFMISQGALKYIFSNAMERKTGRYIQTSPTKEMRYGTKIEPLILRAANEILSNEGLEIQKVGFKIFENFPTAGVSSDGKVVKIETGELIASAELKACTTWGTLFERTFELMDDSSIDFWQTQGQMLAYGVDKNYYIVAEPVKDIDLYLRAENIMDYYEQWIEETKITIQVVKSSPIHQNALFERIKIAEEIVCEWLSVEDSNLKEVFYEIIEKHKKIYFNNLPKQELPSNTIDKVLEEKEHTIDEFQQILDSNVVFEEVVAEAQKAPAEEKKISFDDITNDLPF